MQGPIRMTDSRATEGCMNAQDVVGATEAKEFLILAKAKKLYGVNPKRTFDSGMILSAQTTQISSFVCIDVRNWRRIIRFNVIVYNYEKQAKEAA